MVMLFLCKSVVYESIISFFMYETHSLVMHAKRVFRAPVQNIVEFILIFLRICEEF
jgi:hypothetical protein